VLSADTPLFTRRLRGVEITDQIMHTLDGLILGTHSCGSFRGIAGANRTVERTKIARPEE
jgi:hypothetical protein